ncbi:MAG: hypothetical protein IJF02_01750 [Oscillospiraceae bacterium]|nr:hypothetical protein [Oscillospiraceae bacterium]
MNEVWNLDSIYKSFVDPAFEADLNAGKEKLQEFTAFAAGLADMDPAVICLPAGAKKSWPVCVFPAAAHGAICRAI